MALNRWAYDAKHIPGSLPPGELYAAVRPDDVLPVEGHLPAGSDKESAARG